MDKEYIVLNEIDKNSNITQRELSKVIQCSLGSINILLNKMAIEGLIKIKRMPMNRILYMLTPIGIVEKLQKTSDYITSNYNYIIDTQAKIRAAIEGLIVRHGEIDILIEKDEISEIVKLSIEANNNVKLIKQADTCDNPKPVVVLNINTYNKLKKECRNVINLIELI
ncbi:MAG: winged helix-turn-helix transcriptional regulator [Ruminiclostridium sp.]